MILIAALNVIGRRRFVNGNGIMASNQLTPAEVNAAQTLCRDIAELEGVTCPMCGGTGRSTGKWSTLCRMCAGTGYPLYITDPAETVRMLDEIRRRSTAYEWEVFSQELWLRSAIPIPVATAEAYLAMLLAKQGRDGEDG